jgi:hypothetical protein
LKRPPAPEPEKKRPTVTDKIVALLPMKANSAVPVSLTSPIPLPSRRFLLSSESGLKQFKLRYFTTRLKTPTIRWQH